MSLRLKRIFRSKLNRLFIFETKDGYSIESVFYRGDTLCISSQVGCAIRCGFCSSGRYGFFRNLSVEEIVSQYLLLKDRYPVKGVAIAGIGEPSMNVDNVVEAVDFFKQHGLRVTVSTTGYPANAFRRILATRHDGVTLSLHAVKQEVRDKLFLYSESIDTLLSLLDSCFAGMSRRRRKRIQIGYLLLKGINDDMESLNMLSRIAERFGLVVMLMMYNEVAGLPYKRVDDDKYESIFKFLRDRGIRVTLSNRFRLDPVGGCGTLTLRRGEGL